MIGIIIEIVTAIKSIMNSKLIPMKKILYYLACLAVVNATISCKRIGPEGTDSGKKSITVFCTPELNNITSEWASGFSMLNPEYKIEVKNADKSLTGIDPDFRSNLFFIPGEQKLFTKGADLWKMKVGRDVIVPLINSKNPCIKDIYAQGISIEQISRLLTDPSQRSWRNVLNIQSDALINIYVSEEAGLEDITGENFSDKSIIKVAGVKELISLVEADPYSVGICRAGSIPSSGFPGTIAFLPVDRNNNRKIDYMEKIHSESLTRSLWIGKYPRDLYENIYTVSAEKPSGKAEMAFLTWILTNGQHLLADNGYSVLTESEIRSNVDLLNISPVISVSKTSDPVAMEFFLVFGFIVVMILLVTPFFMESPKKDLSAVPMPVFRNKIFEESAINIPDGLFYDKTHSWAFMEKDGIVITGIDDFLQSVTGPLNRVQMKEPGTTVKKGEKILSVMHNGKHLDIYSPVTGTIKEHNRSLAGNPSLLNSSPYSEGWVYKIEAGKWLSDLQFLVPGKKYGEWIKGEFSRLKESIPVFYKEGQAILQDGGELKTGILADLVLKHGKISRHISLMSTNNCDFINHPYKSQY